MRKGNGCNFKNEKIWIAVQSEKREANKITKHIVLFLCLFIVIVAIATVGFAMLMRNDISCLTINDTVDLAWISSLASYWGGVIGEVISGVLALLGVFYAIKYYKESDEQKEKSLIQSFLLVTVGADKEPPNGFELGPKTDGKNYKTS